VTALAPAPAAGPGSGSRFRSGWVWLPLSFIFLLLGVVLGFQIAIGFHSSKPVDPSADPYLLDLSAVKFGDNIHLKWNTDAPALGRAQRGLLSIDDGGNTKLVELSREDLARGSVLYRHTSGSVRFRLEVQPRERNAVSESLDVRLTPDQSAPERTSAPPAAKAEPRRGGQRR
jgi:hypothetical protein